MTQYSGVYTLQTQGQALTSGQWCTDPYYKNTTLLLHADGVAGGAQNNTFLDSSSNAFAITRNGNTTQGSFTPYGPTWSNYFSGSGSTFIYAENTAGIQPAANDFTFECWFYGISTTYNGALLAYGNPGVYGPFNVYTNTTGLLAVPISTTGSSWNIEPDADIAGSAWNLNTWNHVAVCRSGTTIRVFLNGVVVRTTTGVSGALMTPTENLKCGSRNGSEQFNGYISNWRLVIGTGLYTANFIPSTTPLTAVTNTKILWCSTNALKDATGVYPTLAYGTPSVQRFSPFAPQYQYTPAVIGGSNYADGTGANYLTAPVNAAFALGSNSFTVEGWIYLTQFNTYNFIYNRASGGTNATTEIELNVNSSGTLNCSVYVSSTQYSVGAATGAIKLNQWQHIAFVRNGTSGQIYINGVASGSAVTITGSLNDTSSAPNIRYQAPSANRGMTGYLADFRLVNGTAVYTGTFTPPTGPFSASMGANPFGGSNTAAATATLLLNSTNAGITDNAMMNNLETVGNAQVSTSVVKYGSGSLAFDGTGDYLVSNPASTDLYAFGTGDFTIEFWLYVNTVFGTQIVYDCRPTGTNGAQPIVFVDAGVVKFQHTSSVRITGPSLVTGTWYHIAVARSGTNTKMFVNGIQGGSTYTSDTTAYTNSSQRPIIGVDAANTSINPLNGYIDDLRITKGVARYTANFQPPKVAFANQ
jgi:hypothetical protein